MTGFLTRRDGSRGIRTIHTGWGTVASDPGSRPITGGPPARLRWPGSTRLGDEVVLTDIHHRRGAVLAAIVVPAADDPDDRQ